MNEHEITVKFTPEQAQAFLAYIRKGEPQHDHPEGAANELMSAMQEAGFEILHVRREW